MSSTLIFSSLRRTKLPRWGAFFTPADLSDLALIQTIASVGVDLVAVHAKCSDRPPFQRRNSRSLIQKVRILIAFLESLGNGDCLSRLPLSARTCLNEIYIIIYRARALLDFCSESSSLWLLIQNPQIAGHFHDLNLEIATLLDVFPLRELGMASDVQEQVELLHRQCRRSRLFMDPRDEDLRFRIFSFLDEFEKCRSPDLDDLRAVFVYRLRIRDAKACRLEIEHLEERMYSQDEDTDLSTLSGVVALVRYCQFLLFGFHEERVESDQNSFLFSRIPKSNSAFQGIRDSSFAIPKDFCCPISLDLMRDPVITSSGQSYDRDSITQWMEDGHCTCPNSGQTLSHTGLIPNRALRNLISHWCAAHAIPYHPQDGHEASAECTATPSSTRAASEANRKTAELLVRKLSIGSELEKTVAAREIRLLAKTGKENRACIAESGAIPLLQKLLCSPSSFAQENSVTAILNLSIHEKNKRRIMEQEGCLTSIVYVLINGLTTEARENAAATLFSLSAVHAYKKRITDEPGAVEALAVLLKLGTPRGKKDAVTALFNLSTHPDCSVRMVESGAVSALTGALTTQGVTEEAAGALALLVRQKLLAEVVGKDDSAVASLVSLMRRGSAKGKENAVAALHELCRSGGTALTQKVARTPSLGGLIQTIYFTGTKRARRKAASLVRLCQRCEPPAADAPPLSVWGLEYGMTRSGSVMRGSGFGSGDASVSVSLSISVPVL